MPAGDAELAPTSGAANEPTVPTGEADDVVEVDDEEDDELEPVDELTVCGHGDTCETVEMEGKEPDDDDPELLEDGAGVGACAGAELVVGGGGADEENGEGVPAVVGATVAGWVCAKAFRPDPRKIAPAMAARETKPFRNGTFDELRIIEGDP